MQQGMRILGLGLMTALWLGIGTGARAQEVNLMQGVTPRPGDDRMTAANQFKKNGPWKVGMSHFGVNANTWTVQMAHDAEAAAARDKRIGQFILLDANISQAKQVADIEDL
jgi:ribose transport system substrate-binding protein